MQLNYIILAHKNPAQLKRLIEKLSVSKAFFYVHIDKNTEIELFVNEISNFKNVIFVGKREQGTWGDIGIVKATVNALRQILKDDRKGYCILLSGQDYPIKKNEEIDSYLEYNRGNEFINIFPMPTKYWLFEGIDRIEKYKFNLSSRRYHYVQIPSVYESEFYTKKNLRKIYGLIKIKHYGFVIKVFRRRKFPCYIKPFGGSQWWALTIDTISKIVIFLDKYPDYIEYHKYSLLPDEMFFQSIVMNLIENGLEINIEQPIMYTNWVKKDVELPVTFTSVDFKELSTQPYFKLFARKFDIEVDNDILDQLDNWHKTSHS